MPNEEHLCDLYGHECKELAYAWNEYNQLHDAYVALRNEVKALRVITHGRNTHDDQGNGTQNPQETVHH